MSKIFITSLVPDTKLVKRSWYTRLFTRPWRPLMRFKEVFSPRIRQYSDGTMMMSARTYAYIQHQQRLEKALKEWDDGENSSENTAERQGTDD